MCWNIIACIQYRTIAILLNNTIVLERREEEVEEVVVMVVVVDYILHIALKYPYVLIVIGVTDRWPNTHQSKIPIESVCYMLQLFMIKISSHSSRTKLISWLVYGIVVVQQQYQPVSRARYGQLGIRKQLQTDPKQPDGIFYTAGRCVSIYFL